jgi:DNA adenine methylase
LQNKSITLIIAKSFLEKEGELLEKSNGEHYYIVRERFNKYSNPLDFLFLNRACFNVPFCKKPNRFAQAYITKIVNQIENIQGIINLNNYSFLCQSFDKTLENIDTEDLIYCDPPYIGRHVDYFDSWNEDNEIKLHKYLIKNNVKFIFSTWHSNEYRKNIYIESLWKDLQIYTKEHFYHVGGSEDNRKPMLEALLTNFSFDKDKIEEKKIQTYLF